VEEIPSIFLLLEWYLVDNHPPKPRRPPELLQIKYRIEVKNKTQNKEYTNFPV